jgi:hypothetical protein
MAKVRLYYMKVDGKFTNHYHVPAWERKLVRAGWRGKDYAITETPTHETIEVDTSVDAVNTRWNVYQATYGVQNCQEQLRSPETLMDDMQKAIEDTARWLADEKARQERDAAEAAKRNEAAIAQELAELESDAAGEDAELAATAAGAAKRGRR